MTAFDDAIATAAAEHAATLTQLRNSQNDGDALRAQVTDLEAQLADCQGGGEPPPPPPPTGSDLLLGTSMSDNPHPGNWGTARCYDATAGRVDVAVNTHHARRIDLTHRDDTKNPATVVSRIQALLTRYPSVAEVDNAHENEVDRKDHRGGSQASIDAWASEHAAIQRAVHAQWPDGKVKTAVDFIRDQIENGTAGASYKMLVALQKLNALPDVLAFSAYPKQRVVGTSPPQDPHSHIGVGVDLAAQFGIEWVSVWEIGTPLSNRYNRPAYVGAWAPYFRDYAESKGVKPRSFDYWDQQKAGDVDNRFAADGSTATRQGATQQAFMASIG